VTLLFSTTIHLTKIKHIKKAGIGEGEMYDRPMGWHWHPKFD
jgi:hypothetical protein